MLLLLAGCALFEPIPADPVDGDRDGVGAALDCDDGNANVGSPRRYWVDGDADGFGGDVWTDSCEVVQGFVTDGGDCDDANAAVGPLMTEICNGLDDDCDGMVDGRTAFGARPMFVDGDGDGHGDPRQERRACYVTEGLSLDRGDCDDRDGRVYRGAPETCDNGIDEDCDGTDRSCWLGGLVSANRADVSFVATQYGWFGASVAAGDLDGDGWADVVLGAPYLSAGASGGGGAYVFRSPRPGRWLASDADDAWIGAAGQGAGAAVAVGPLDDDAADEVVLLGLHSTWLVEGTAGTGLLDEVSTQSTSADLAAPIGEGAGVDEPSIALVTTRRVSVWSSPFVEAPYEVVWSGDLVHLEARDLDGDGAVDLLLTEQGETARVFVVPGPLVPGPAPLDEIGILVAEGVAAEGFAADAASGDLDGDGHVDLVAGAAAAGGSMHQSGVAFVFAGPLGAPEPPIGRLTGEARSDQAGHAVAIVGDMDGDGGAELVVGAPGHAAAGGYAGAVYVWRGPVVGVHGLAGADLKITGDGTGAYLGWSVADAGDVNGDGLGDLLVGAPGTRYGSVASAGAAYLFLGRPAL